MTPSGQDLFYRGHQWGTGRQENVVWETFILVDSLLQLASDRLTVEFKWMCKFLMVSALIISFLLILFCQYQNIRIILMTSNFAERSH